MFDSEDTALGRTSPEIPNSIGLRLIEIQDTFRFRCECGSWARYAVCQPDAESPTVENIIALTCGQDCGGAS